MKTNLGLLLLILLTASAHAQLTSPSHADLLKCSPDVSGFFASPGDRNLLCLTIPAGFSSIGDSAVKDSSKYNMYGDLRNDDPAFNPKSPWYVPVGKVAFANLFTFSVDKFIFNYDFSNIGFSSWAYNIKNGWEWDQDRFGMNFFFHPYTGGAYFGAARSVGYDFWESIPFAVGGSLMWEYFGENTRPSYSDLITTTLAGAFGGEILYRLSSQILDDRTSGAERFFREAAAAIMAPTRFTSRLMQGELWRSTQNEVYQKEPVNVTLYAGAQIVNDGAKFGTGPTNAMANLQLDYGNPFENIDRKPYDFFKLRADLSFGAGRKIIDNVTGYGMLYGANAPGKVVSAIYGIFQYYDFWDNKTFELGTLGFGGGYISKFPVITNLNLYTAFHVAAVPLAGNSNLYGPDTTEVRDYNYGGGLEAKGEATFGLGSWGTATLAAYYFWFHTYVGIAGDNFIGIVKPRVTVGLFGDVSLGFEQVIYYGDRYPRDFAALHTVRTEQKLFLLIFLEDSQRYGRYN